MPIPDGYPQSMIWTKYLSRLLPGWLLNNWGLRFVYSTFMQFDLIRTLAHSARKQSLILEEQCGADAILMKGQEFNFPKYNIESTVNYKARVTEVWDTKEYVGTKHGINLVLEAVLNPSVHQTSTFTITESVSTSSFTVKVNQPNNIPLITSSEQEFVEENVVPIIRDIIKNMKGLGPVCNAIIITRFDNVDFHYPGC